MVRLPGIFFVKDNLLRLRNYVFYCRKQVETICIQIHILPKFYNKTSNQIYESTRELSKSNYCMFNSVNWVT